MPPVAKQIVVCGALADPRVSTRIDRGGTRSLVVFRIRPPKAARPTGGSTEPPLECGRDTAGNPASWRLKWQQGSGAGRLAANPVGRQAGIPPVFHRPPTLSACPLWGCCSARSDD